MKPSISNAQSAPSGPEPGVERVLVPDPEPVSADEGTPLQRLRLAGMVGWYNPLQLVRTGVQVAISGVFGRYSDPRLIEPFGAGAPEYYDYSQHPGTFWFDYAADIGDGWNSSYAVARALALVASRRDERLACSGHPGRILVFGGDEVYPLANKANYDQRAELPYRVAFARAARRPDVFALPGNHDWYDSLVSFGRRFCARTPFAGGRTWQRRSYFALRLPHNWWLMGTDLQLGSEIDVRQLEYFGAVMDLARRESAPHEPNVILCHAEPLWMYREKYGNLDPEYLESNLRVLEERVFRKSVRLFLAGDQHHYLRYAPAAGGKAPSGGPPLALVPALAWAWRRLFPSGNGLHQPRSSAHKITAGGGGAFLHPTHDKPTTLSEGLELAKAWPPRRRSFALTFLNLAFLPLNPMFGAVTALMYLLTCASMQPGLPALSVSGAGTALHRVLMAVSLTPAAMFWVTIVLLGFVLFTDTHSKIFRVLGGLAHGLAHLAAAFTIGWAAASYCTPRIHEPLLERMAEGGLVLLGGFMLGPLVMGMYLLIALVIFGRHANEAFSSLRLEGYKNFLRLQIDERGLTVHPLGIENSPWTRVAARRAFRRAAGGALPTEPIGREPSIQAIEAPIHFPHRGGES
jgi:hypothetical protein